MVKENAYPHFMMDLYLQHSYYSHTPPKESYASDFRKATLKASSPL